MIAIEDDGSVILGEENETYAESFSVIDVNYQGFAPLGEGESFECRVQVRYRHTPIRCRITKMNEDLVVNPLEEVRGVTPGQSAVFYPLNSDYLLLGGIIRKGSIRMQVAKEESAIAFRS